MNKILWTTAVLSLLLAACGNNEESESVTPNLPVETIEEVAPEETTDDELEEEEEDDAVYNPEDTMVGAITDTEPIPLEEYDEDKWTFFDSRDTGERVESGVFAEEDRLYIGTERHSIIALDYDSNIFWEDQIPAVSFGTDFTMDDTQVYSPSMGGKRSDDDHIAAISKETGNVNYEIDISEYAEISEFLIGDEAFYVTLGKMEDIEEDLYAGQISLHKFDKITGERVWETEINGVPLGHGRANHYVLEQNDELIFIFEHTDDGVQRIVGRSKVDGTEVWSTVIGGEDREDGARLGRLYHSNGAVYTIDGFDMIHVFDDMTGEKITEHPFNGYQPGGMVPLPIVHEDLFIWQHGTEDYHHLKAVDPKAGKDLWVLDMDGHFLVDYEILEDTLYAFFGSLDYDAEENTLMARIDPYTGEVLDVVDLGTSISAKLNNFYVRMGLTEYNGKLAYFYDNLVYIFNE